MKKCKVIAVVNQKGGVGKTTTSINLAAALTALNNKVLAVDLDPQGNLTTSFGFNADSLDKTVADIFTAEITNAAIEDKHAILTTYENVELLPANISLATIETQIVGLFNRDTILKTHLKKLRELYEYIIIDCSPALSTLTYNALLAADSVLVPCQPQLLSTVGLQQLLTTIQKVQQVSPSLKTEGILLTMTRPRLKHETEVENFIREFYLDKIKILPVKIPQTVKIPECTAAGVSIVSYARGSKAAAAYMQLAEIISEVKCFNE